ncbi:MAG: transporter substrate-binding domain-containing protein [Deltaproteobacteria bacterium]|nr:transporter substrate-binding domain-containing protein [Deltaproteobacteria bacterium]
MKPYSINALISGSVSTVISLAVLFVFGGLSFKTAGQRVISQSVYAQIRSAGTIRAGYAVGAPLFMIDPNSKQKSGIFYEILNAAAAKLGLKVDWTEEVGYGEMIQGLNAHRYDIVGSGVWINGARGKDADFTIPAYYDAVLAYVREGDARFDKDLSILNSPGYTISIMDGELGATIAKTDFPRARTEELPQNADFTQLILNVVNGRADLVFLALAPARQYQAANPRKIRAVNPNRPVRVFPVAIILPKGEYEIKHALDYALTEMLTNGEIDSILKRHEKIPGSFFRSAPPYQMTGFTQ